jgi:hypothetical protein
MNKGIYRLDIGPYSYIGSALFLDKRINKHYNLLKKGIHGNEHMQNVFNKYKIFSYRVLEYLEEDEDQFEVEQLYLDCLNFNDKFTLNKSFVARGMNSEMAKAISLKHRQKMILNLNSKGSIAKRTLTAQSIENREQMSKTIKNKWKEDPEYREKGRINATMRGRVSSLIRNGFKGLFPSKLEYRTSLSDTFIEYYRIYGINK